MSGRGPTYSEAEAREAIGSSISWSGALRKLGLCPTGGGPAILKKHAERWGISAEHFDPYRGVMEAIRKPKLPMEEILVTGSTFSRGNLKARLYEEGFKQPICEMCGQGELWQGRQISMIIDHVNGVRDDNRLENLRIVCPNCAATLDTHCGRARAGPPPLRNCLVCGELYRAKNPRQKFCSRECSFRRSGAACANYGQSRPGQQKVDRPPRDQLLEEIESTSFVAVGKKYGVSDNAVRKWVRWYERQDERELLDLEKESNARERQEALDRLEPDPALSSITEADLARLRTPKRVQSPDEQAAA